MTVSINTVNYRTKGVKDESEIDLVAPKVDNMFLSRALRDSIG